MPESRPEAHAAEAGGGWLVVGLGNPGPAYAGNRHNVGAMVLDTLAQRVRGRWRAARRGNAVVVQTRLGDEGSAGSQVVLAKPRSFMNDVGGPVSLLLRSYSIHPSWTVVVHDEIDLPVGSLRVKLGGGDNGHNGLRSLRHLIGTGEFFRVRIGVGRPPGRQDPADFVLRDFPAVERRELPVLLELAADAVECLVTEGLTRAQDRFNA